MSSTFTPDESPVHAEYDIIIVGGGISGLFSARELSKRYPRKKIALLERYKGFGGRTYSYSPSDYKDIQWEMGAARIHKSHKLLLKLIKDYKLNLEPLSNKSSYQTSPGAPLESSLFSEVHIPIYLEPLAKLSPEILATNTIEDIMIDIYGEEHTKKILDQYPYKAEVNTLRADLALSTFLEGGEMNSDSDYYVISEGFSELIKRLRYDVESRGVFTLNRHRVINLKKGLENSTTVFCEFGRKEKNEPHGFMNLSAKYAVILALHKDAVSEFPVFQSWEVLNYLKTKPLLRQYAIFPTKEQQSWFSKLGRIITPERPRYIIPIDDTKGVLMISYTDADDTKYYSTVLKKGGDKALEKTVLKDVRSLFPTISIPNPLFFRSHMWETGCTYWLPGNYDPFTLSDSVCNPFPSKLPTVWLCGESWSTKQAWVEGALEHTTHMIKKLSKHMNKK